MKKIDNVITYSVLINTETKKIALVHIKDKDMYVFLACIGPKGYNTLEASYLTSQKTAKRVSEVLYSFNDPVVFCEEEIIKFYATGITEELYVTRDLGECSKPSELADNEEIVWLDVEEVDKLIYSDIKYQWEKAKPVVEAYFKDIVPGRNII